jgi:hypothetical protein
VAKAAHRDWCGISPGSQSEVTEVPSLTMAAVQYSKRRDDDLRDHLVALVHGS